MESIQEINEQKKEYLRSYRAVGGRAMKERFKDMLLVAIILSAPIWIIPYLICHYKIMRKELD